MFCSQCGNKCEDDAKFCGKCGTPIFITNAYLNGRERIQSNAMSLNNSRQTNTSMPLAIRILLALVTVGIVATIIVSVAKNQSLNHTGSHSLLLITAMISGLIIRSVFSVLFRKKRP